MAHTQALWMSAAATVRVILIEGLLCAGVQQGRETRALLSESPSLVRPPKDRSPLNQYSSH